ncbi:MAG TPA: endonuclease/exonuclease/phosphatase family protein [Polyangia bacterium]|jgi:endonuclease/exonuclease/phosphatase family metal-dependent hydrolase|nr:endonuclease/exonuclease/phosphatase family protein [Polyangia bacterium]
MTHKFLRFLTLNLWGENGPWENRLALVAEKLDSLQPDVVALQEVRAVPGRVMNQAQALAGSRGYAHVFAPTTEWGGGHEGLAVLSRPPIGAHEIKVLPHATPQEGRGLLSARIDSPDFGSFWVHSTHLSYREHEGDKREAQVLAIEDALAAHKSDNPQILMGDFNAVPHADEIRWLCGLTTLGGRRVYYQDAWDILHAGQPGFTWARSNPYTERLAFLRSDRRLDYIFVTPPRRDGRGTLHSARLMFDEPAVMPSGERLFASDHYGVVAEVQMAANHPGSGPTLVNLPTRGG